MPVRSSSRVQPGFATMLESDRGQQCAEIIVETASGFARDLMVAGSWYAKLRERGIDFIVGDNRGSFIDDTPTAKLVRQVLGALSKFDKAMTVAKLRGVFPAFPNAQFLQVCRAPNAAATHKRFDCTIIPSLDALAAAVEHRSRRVASLAHVPAAVAVLDPNFPPLSHLLLSHRK
jgi:Resolvase, N terminal domain